MAFRVRVLHSLLLGLAGFSLVLCSFFYATPVSRRYEEGAQASAAAAALVAADSTSTPHVTTASTLAAVPSAAEASATDNGGEDPLAGGGKRSLQASEDAARPSGQDAKGIPPAQAALPAENKAPTTDGSVSGSAGVVNGAAVVVPAAPDPKSAAAVPDGQGSAAKAPAVKTPAAGPPVPAVLPSASQQPEEPGSQPAAPVSTAAAASAAAASAVGLSGQKSPGINHSFRSQSVIQRIVPKTTAPGGSSGGRSGTNNADFTSLGIVTKSMYEAGHDIPNSETCLDFGKSLKVAILITSAPSHADARMAIRQTWGHYNQRNDISIAFLLGATADSNIQKDIYSESEMYGDIIQSHFQDSYNNLTLKTISLLEWVDTYCYQVSFILKTDDDMFINVPRLLTFIDKHANDKRTIFGRLAKKWKPIRNKKSKYYVSKEQYKHVLFPDFTTGPAYLMTGDVVHDLYTSALNQTYLKLEDVYTTGIVAQEMKVKRVHVNEFLNKRIVFHPCHIQKGISIHMVKFHEQFDLWKKLLDGKTKCK